MKHKRDKEYNKGKPPDTRAYRYLYKRGELPPNYPMPAVPLSLEIFEMAGIPALGLFEKTSPTTLKAHAFWFDENHPLYSGDPIRF